MSELLFQPRLKTCSDGSVVLIVEISGAIDHTTVRLFEDTLINFYNQGHQNLVLIFAQVKYINSTGMGVLVKLADKFQESGGDIKLVGVSEKIISLFDMLGLLSLFKIYATEEEAIESILSSPGARAPLPAAYAPPCAPAPAAYAPPCAPAPPISAPRTEPVSPSSLPESVGYCLSADEEDISRPASFRRAEELPVEVSPPVTEPPERPSPKPAAELDLKRKPHGKQEETFPSPVRMSPVFLPPVRRKPGMMGAIRYFFRWILYLPYHAFLWIGFLPARLWKRWERCREEASSAGIPLFEILFSENAGTPGPVERLVAQSRLLMRTIQAMVGLKFILLANALDIVVDAVVGYVGNIFAIWKTMRTIQRRLERERSHTQVISVVEDFSEGRIRLARFFEFAGFELEDDLRDWSFFVGLNWITAPTFLLKQALELRGHLDNMKRDLDFLTFDEASQFVRKSTKDFMLSLIPNPMNFLLPWKDLFILAFVMKYPRCQIERMYMDFVISYEHTIRLLEKKYSQQSPIHTRMEWERQMFQRLGEGRTLPPEEIASVTEMNRKSLQRMTRVLCNPGQFINPCHWSLSDLIQEVWKAKSQMETAEETTISLEYVSPQIVLELERRLTRLVSDYLTRQKVRVGMEEWKLRLAEAKCFRLRLRLERRCFKRISHLQTDWKNTKRIMFSASSEKLEYMWEQLRNGHADNETIYREARENMPDLLILLQERDKVTRNKAGWVITRLGPDITKLQRLSFIENPREIISLYLQLTMAKLEATDHQVQDALQVFRDFNDLEVKIALSTLVRHLILSPNPSQPISHLKRETERIRQSLLTWIGGIATPSTLTEREIVSFITNRIQ